MMAKLIAAIGPRLIGLGAPLLAKIALGAVAVWLVTLVGGAGFGLVQSWRLNNAQEREDRAVTLLEVCKSSNVNLSGIIERNTIRNEERIEAAAKAQAKAETLAEQAQEQREALTHELQDQIERLQNASSGNVCAADIVGDDVGRVLSEADY